MFLESWMEKQVRSIIHLMVENGNILKLEEFNEKYNLNCSFKNYTKVIQNIPTALIQLIQNNLENNLTPKWQKITLHHVDLLDRKCNNKCPRQHFVNNIYPGQTKSTLKIQEYVKKMKYLLSEWVFF